MHNFNGAYSTRRGAHTVGVKLKFPFSFRGTEQKRYTVPTKNQLQN